MAVAPASSWNATVTLMSRTASTRSPRNGSADAHGSSTEAKPCVAVHTSGLNEAEMQRHSGPQRRS